MYFILVVRPPLAVCVCVHSAHSWRLIESQLPLQGQCCVLCALCKSRGHCGAVFVLSNAKYASVKWWARQQKEERETPYIVSFSIFKSPVIFLSLSLLAVGGVAIPYSVLPLSFSSSLSLCGIPTLALPYFTLCRYPSFPSLFPILSLSLNLSPFLFLSRFGPRYLYPHLFVLHLCSPLSLFSFLPHSLSLSIFLSPTQCCRVSFFPNRCLFLLLSFFLNMIIVIFDRM